MQKITFLFYSAVILVLLLLGACSTLPGKEDNKIVETKNKAAESLNKGIFQFNAGRYDRALVLFEQALILNSSLDYEEGVVTVLNSIARTKLILGDEDEALSLLNKAMETAKRLGDESLVLISSGNLAEFYIKTGDLIKAEIILEEKLPDPTVIDTDEEALLGQKYSLLLRKRKQYDRSLIYLQSTLNYHMEKDSFKELASDYYMMASIHSLKKEYEQAISFGKKALQYDKMIEYPQGIAADLDALSIIFEKAGQSEQAVIYTQRYKSVIDAINAINQIEDERNTNDTTKN